MAGVLGPHRSDHLHLRRDHVELLGGILADAHQAVAALTLLVLLGQVDDPIDPRQRLRQRFAPRATTGSLKHFGGRLIRGRLIRGRLIGRLVLWGVVVGGVFDLVEQPDLLQLGGGELFAAASVQLVLEPGKLFFVEVQLLVQFSQFRVQFIVPGGEMVVFRRQLFLFQKQMAILCAQRIALFGDR